MIEPYPPPPTFDQSMKDPQAWAKHREECDKVDQGNRTFMLLWAGLFVVTGVAGAASILIVATSMLITQ